MALANRDELRTVLTADPTRLGRVFARHAYGMRAWVDLFSSRIPGIDDPVLKAMVAGVVGDNARHMMLFRARAAAHGVDPDTYACPDEGEDIYERIPALTEREELLGYALGSLDHFEQLLAVYAEAARGDDRSVIDEVRADNTRARETMRPMVGARGAVLADEAHERYRVRELAETPSYAR